MLAGGVALTIAIGAMAQVGTFPASQPMTTISSVVVVNGLVKSAAKTAAPVTKPKAIIAAAAVTPGLTQDTLPPLDLTDMKLWNWAGVWHASEWENWQSSIPWKYNHVSQPTKTDAYFSLDEGGAPELQAQGGTLAHDKGIWEADVTVPTLRDGMVVAPLWLYDSSSKDEIDFEFAGRKGLDVSMHVYVNGIHKQSTIRLLAGKDMSGQRLRFGIKVDEASGYVEMYLNGVRVYSWNSSGMSYFVSHPLKPVISMWAARPTDTDNVSWLGKWAGIKSGESVKLIVHGYRYSPLR